MRVTVCSERESHPCISVCSKVGSYPRITVCSETWSHPCITVCRGWEIVELERLCYNPSHLVLLLQVTARL